MRGDPGGRKQNSTVAVRGAGDDGADRVRRGDDRGRCSRGARLRTLRTRGRRRNQDLAHPTKALCKKPSYKIGYDVFSEQPAVCRQPDGRTHQRRQEHRLRAGREDGRQPQRARRRRQRQDAPERGHRRIRRLPGARGLPAGDREAPEVGEGSGRHRRRRDAARIPAGRAGTVPDREERRHLHGEAGEEAVPGPDPVLPRRRRADLRTGRPRALQGCRRRHQAGLPEHSFRITSSR